MAALPSTLPPVTHSFLVVFEIGDFGARTGNAEMRYSGPPTFTRPSITVIKAWEQSIRERLSEDTVVITNFLPLAYEE